MLSELAQDLESSSFSSNDSDGLEPYDSKTRGSRFASNSTRNFDFSRQRDLRASMSRNLTRNIGENEDIDKNQKQEDNIREEIPISKAGICETWKHFFHTLVLS